MTLHTVTEINLDGLIGPTHNYAGLAPGNLASEANTGKVSRPREAALQGLRKARALYDLGIPQGFLPPQHRPDLEILRELGFEGSAKRALETVAREAPLLLGLTSSASSMWAANAATVTPSADATDGRVHLTPANLRTNFHRAIEADQTTRTLRAIFADSCFVVHDPLPSTPHFSDEGAANHTRLERGDGRGVHLFVYGRLGFGADPHGPRKAPARQTLEACQAVARRHRLRPEDVVFLRQNPAAIDLGVFHHDVIGVGHRCVLLVHEDAFADAHALEHLRQVIGDHLTIEQVGRDELSIPDAVRSYLFNSQIVTAPDGEVILVAPLEAQEVPAAAATIQRLIEGPGPIGRCVFLDVRQSMDNGGGPACLRLRVPLTPQELPRMGGRCLADAGLFDDLENWIARHYREELQPKDLSDPALGEESMRALDELTELLKLGAIYPFQQASGL